MLFGGATECLRSSPASHGPSVSDIQCRPDFGTEPSLAVFPAPRSPTTKSGNGSVNSPVTRLAFDLISNLAVEMSPGLKTPRRCLLDSLAAASDPSASAMDVDAEAAEPFAPNGEPESPADDCGDDMDVDDGSPLGRLKPAAAFRQTKLSFARARLPSPPPPDTIQDSERASGAKRPISSLSQPLRQPAKLPGRSPFGRELTSHWSQRRPMSFGREPSKFKQPTLASPSCKLKCEGTPTLSDTPTMSRMGPVATEDSPSDVVRPADHGMSPSVAAPPAKFRRTQESNPNGFPLHRFHPHVHHSDNLPGLPAVFAEGSTILPSTETGKDALKRISPNTLVDLLDGRYKDKYDEHHIIDCRFPYEFEGGHIPSAVNVNTMDALEKMFVDVPITDKKVLLVFHCEFSSQRAPRIALHLRNQDRRMNMHNYPHLHYPEVYILKGGYKDFFAQYKERCSPQTYVEMAHEDFKEECKVGMSLYKGSFKRSKSYTEGPSGNCAVIRRSASFAGSSTNSTSFAGSLTNSASCQRKPDIF